MVAVLKYGSFQGGVRIMVKLITIVLSTLLVLALTTNGYAGSKKKLNPGKSPVKSAKAHTVKKAPAVKKHK